MLVGVWLVYGVFGLAIASLPPVAEQVGFDLGLTRTQFGLAQSAWAFVFTCVAVPAGNRLDRINPATALFVACLVVAISLVGRAYAEGLWSLMLATGVFGLAAPVLSIGAPKMIAHCFGNAREQRLAIGIYSTAPLAGIVLAMAMTQSVFVPALGGSWRACMLAYAGVVSLCAFAWFRIQRRYLQPMKSATVPMPVSGHTTEFRRLLARSDIRLMLGLGAVTFVMTNGLDAWLPTVLRQHRMSAAGAGYWAALPSLAGIFAALLVPMLTHASRGLQTVAAMLALCTFGALVLAWGSLPWVLVALPVIGFARSAIAPILSMALLQSPKVGTRSTGVALGLFFTAAQLGGVIGPVGIGFLADLTGDFRIALSSVAALGALAGLLARIEGAKASVITASVPRPESGN